MTDAMQRTDASNVELLRAFFRQLNRFMLLMWRLGLGPWISNPQRGYIMVLTTIGHKSGQKRRAPVNFEQEDGAVYCLAGFGKRTHWYRNLQADPHCEVWLPDGWWAGLAETVTDPVERLRLLRRVLIRSGFAARLFEGIDPAVVSDDELRALAEDYEIVRIRLMARRSGPDGPGDLVWVWPILGAALIGALGLWRLMRRDRAR